MKVLLVGPDHEENLSIRYLAGALESEGHEAALATFNSPIDASAAASAAGWADLVGLSMCFQARAPEFLGLARRIKSEDPSKIVVAGGHYASCAAEPLLANHPEIDLVVIHEGERTLVEIADGKPWDEIAGIGYRDGGRVVFTRPRATVEDLDTLPFPDRRGPVYTIAGVPTSYLMGSRGCYGDCAYCCITTLHRMAPGKRFRQRRVERVADEMAGLYFERGTRQFVFHDDNFLVPSAERNHARIAALERALDERGVRDIALAIKCRPADATEPVLRRLRERGLIRVFLGVESATARGLAALERAQSVAESERALEVCAALGISAQFTLMIFHPDATLETLRADAAFLRRFHGNPLNFCRAEIYAGTPLERRMIEGGRAAGDYRGRSYRMLDAGAERACETALALFPARCWRSDSIMQSAIGLDHAAAVVKRFFGGARSERLTRRIERWVRAVNLDTIELLEEIVERSATAEALAKGEARTRRAFARQSAEFRVELERLRMPERALWPRLARPAAAALLAVALPGMDVEPRAAAAQAQAAPAGCSLSGRVIDPSGAVVSGAAVRVIDEQTGAARKATTDEKGQYLVAGLAIGRYTVEVHYPGFQNAYRNGIGVKAAPCKPIDIGLTLAIGCCEMVAEPSVAAEPARPVNLQERPKPFSYVVGTSEDQGTLEGVAKLVYGDKKAWIPIYEANRSTIQKPNEVPYGTLLTIPDRKRSIPKLVSKVLPAGGPVTGEVALDVTLNGDGSVGGVRVIAGNPSLAAPATEAVKQWRYRLRPGSKELTRFVVVVSFGKKAKVSVR